MQKINTQKSCPFISTRERKEIEDIAWMPEDIPFLLFFFQLVTI